MFYIADADRIIIVVGNRSYNLVIVNGEIVIKSKNKLDELGNFL